MQIRRISPILALAVVAGLAAGCSGDGGKEPGKTGQGTTASAAPAAGEVQASKGALSVSGAWVREPANPKVAAAYLEITNTGEADELQSVFTESAHRIELHTVKAENGAETMSKVDSIPVPANGKAVLKPGGYHIMLLDVPRPLKAGGKVRLALSFTKGGVLVVDAPIKTGA
ncbi:copper chaperone PCu(A)C [Longispora albida]|uniref:copper chaperone PCu(A)C n=1 Tax=Longispora albida TaxID=203523 RepID=UPI00036C3564|nr:copper chaperone PCu(A)C [Longispora albida]